MEGERMKIQMLKFTVLTLVGVILLTSWLASACSTPASTTQSNGTPIKIIKLRMGTPNASSSPTELLNQQWVKKIQDETNGRVQITIYPGGTLIDTFGAWDLLQAGAADITPLITGIPGVPFYISGATNTFLYGTDVGGARYAYGKLWEEYPELRAEYKGVQPLFSQGGTEQYVHSKKPIRTIADLKGLQLQPPPGLTELVTKLGATGSMMPGADLYSALDKGILDGAFMPAETLKSSSLADVTQYSTNLPLAGPPTTITSVNLNTWNSLPADIQKVFEDSISFMNAEEDKILLEENQKGIDWAKSKGHEFIELKSADLDKFYRVMEELSLAKAAELDAKGLPGTAIYKEARRLVEEYNAKTK
jgi:TRAP-type transport system periplasmic protein